MTTHAGASTVGRHNIESDASEVRTFGCTSSYHDRNSPGGERKTKAEEIYTELRPKLLLEREENEGSSLM